ncbi:MAG: hypothetical protein DCC68_01300 [Planctomycetota bacterium]|nr:MAG: hypothetical protein DCC68_01300 [Planctomycetota bacterium]
MFINHVTIVNESAVNLFAQWRREKCFGKRSIFRFSNLVPATVILTLKELQFSAEPSCQVVFGHLLVVCLAQLALYFLKLSAECRKHFSADTKYLEYNVPQHYVPFRYFHVSICIPVAHSAGDYF